MGLAVLKSSGTVLSLLVNCYHKKVRVNSPPPLPLNECKKFNLDFFIDKNPDDPDIRSKSDPRQVKFGETVEVQYFEPEAEDFSDDEDLSHENFVNLESEEEPDFL